MSEQPSEDEIKERIELMKQNCPFCKIVKGEIDAKKVFEDDKCIAILDINPATKGHLLLLPKEHYMMMPLVPDDVMGHLGVISNYLCDLLQETFSAKSVTTLIANGAAAGQQSQHFLMHLIPRYDNDELDFSLQGSSEYSNEELVKLADQIKQRLQSK